MAELKGYLPPEGTQNIHQTAYVYRDAQGAHQVGRSIIHSPESVILTSDEFAHKEAERYGLEPLPDDVAREALEAYREGDTDAVAEIVGGHRASDDADSDLSDSDAGEWLTAIDGVGPAKADDLEDAGYASRERVEQATVEDLAAVDGVSKTLAESIKTDVGDGSG